MMTVLKKIMVVTMLFAVASGTALAGATKATNAGTTTKATDGSDSRSAARLAIQLAQYGDKNKDAMALITAASIQVKIGMKVRAMEKDAAKGEAKPGDGSKKALDPSTKGLLERAKQYAGDRKDLIAMADDVAAAGSRGKLEGPSEHVDVVNGAATDLYTDTFIGGQLAKVGISGDGDTDLDMNITDENGNVVCNSATSGDDEYCEFTPAWTGKFFIRVKNYGSVYNRYLIITN